MIKSLLIAISIGFSLTNCSSKIISTTTTTETTKTDTVKTRKVEKTKGDSTGLEFNLEEITGKSLTTGQAVSVKLEQPVVFLDDPIVFHKQIKKGNVTSSIDITKKGNVKVTCKEDSLQHIIDSLTITIEKYKTTTIVTKTIEHKPTTFDIFCRAFTILFFILVLLLIGNKFKKFIPFL